MHQLLGLAQRFRSDERGVFVVFFGLIAIVLVATAGAVVDYSAIEQARSRTQEALDAAALGLQPTIFEPNVTQETIRPQAQSLLEERLDTTIEAEVTTVTINKTEGMLRLEATIEVPTPFVSLVGISSVSAKVLSEATRKRLNVEVAMVLDNSGSMNQQSRMTNLKAAATCAANILFNSDCNSTATQAATAQVKVGIVPFTQFVNVGTGYKNAAWMDGTGASPIAADNFDDDDDDTTPYAGTVDRFALYDQLDNVSWQGCVEARPYPYDTNDTTPSSDTPGTLFVPQFAPDNPSIWGYANSYLNDSPAACNETGTCTYVQVRTGCNDSGASCDRGSDWSSTLTGGPNAPSSCSCDTDGTYTQTLTGPSGDKTRTRTWTCSTSYSPVGLSHRELQERLCKYTGWADTSWGKGPNRDCPTNAMLPLTNTKSSVTAAIGAMYPQGYTNIHQGVIWGFHMLSPTEPLTEGDDYDTATYKVMIVMTDGENTVDGYDASDMNRASGYMAYGYPGSPSHGYNGRIYSSDFPEPASDAEVTSAMNSRTLETCTNAKAAGITIYTIGLNSPNTTTTTMLTNCATAASYAYFPTASSELTSVFTEIAAQLANLRLAK